MCLSVVITKVLHIYAFCQYTGQFINGPYWFAFSYIPHIMEESDIQYSDEVQRFYVKFGIKRSTFCKRSLYISTFSYSPHITMASDIRCFEFLNYIFYQKYFRLIFIIDIIHYSRQLPIEVHVVTVPPDILYVDDHSHRNIEMCEI